MGNEKAKSTLRWLALGFGVALLMIAGELTLTMLHHTMLNMGLFLSVVFFVAAATALPAAPLWGKLTGWSSMAANALVHAVALFLVLSALVLSVNYFAADKEGFSTELALIESRVRKTEYKSRRVSRRVYTRGEPYYVYELELRFADPGYSACSKRVRVPKRQYDALRQGDTVSVAVGRGALGMPVFDDSTIAPLHPRSSSRKASRRHRRPVYRPSRTAD